MQMVITSDETQIQIFADWPMSQTPVKGQQEKSRISCRCRDKETVDRQKLSAENHGQTMLNMSIISDLKRPTAPKILNSLNTMMQRTGIRKCCRFTQTWCKCEALGISWGDCGVSARHLGLVGRTAVVYVLDTWDQLRWLWQKCKTSLGISWGDCGVTVVAGWTVFNAILSKFQVTNRKMKKYEKEYLLKKEQEAQLEDPVERLQVNCTGFSFFSQVYQA